MKFLLSCIVSVTVLSVALLAADKKPKISKGDKVEVDWGGKKIGEFVEFTGTGWLTVKVKSNGMVQTPSFPPDQVKILPKKDKPGDNGVAKGGGNSGSAKMRTWTDVTGKHKTKAKFVELKDDEVTLETDEGKTVTMPLKKLSKEDQKFAQEAAKEDDNPFKSKDDDDNPFAGGSKKSSSDSEGDDDADDEPDVADGDWSSVEQVTIGDLGKWSLRPDVAPGVEKLTTKPIILSSSVKSGGTLSVFEKIDGLLFDRGKGKAHVVLHNVHTKASQLQTVDLVAGKPREPVPYPSRMKPVDFDPAGGQILARGDFMFSPSENKPVVSVWKLGEKGLKPVKSWNVNEPDNIHKIAPTYAQFIDSDHIVTVTFPNKLAMWQVSKAKAIYKMELNHGLPALSPNRKYMMAPVNNGVYVFDALTGDALARLPGDPGSVSAVSFRPDGTQLAALSPQRLLVWDLDKGEIYRDIYFSTAMAATSIDWLERGFILVGGQNLVDLNRRIVLWKYQPEGGQTDTHGYGELGGVFWYALTSQDRKERGLFRARLPHEEALKTADSLRPDELLAVKPGANVTLNFNAQGGDANEQQQALQALTAQLKGLGMNVVNGSPLVLQATTETGKSQQISYRSFGIGGRGVETANVTEQISRLKFVENGKTIWEAVAVGGAPHMLQMKQGESLQQALAKYQKPNVLFFVNVKIPQYVARPSEAGAYGASSLTPQGIQSAPLKAQQPGVAGR